MGNVPHVKRKRLHRRASDTPTLGDVAKHSGVSTASVSRFMSNPDSVSEKRGKMIKSSIDKLGYIPHGAAQALASQRSRTIGVIVPTLNNAIFAEGIQAFQRCLQEKGYTLFIASSDYSLDEELAQAERLISRGVEALMLVGSRHHKQLFSRLNQKKLPYLFTWAFKPESEHPCIGFNNYGAAARQTNYLLDIGHRQFAIISGITHNNDRADDRLKGALDTLDKYGIDLPAERIIECPYDVAQSRQAMKTLLESKRPPTAVICGNDVIAYGALLESQACGKSVPADLSIVGFDDLALSSHLQPPLTTMQVPSMLMGEKAAEYLLARLDNETAPDHFELDVNLIVRETTAPPSKG